VCRAKEADLVEQGARLAERELNAEQGFLAEKARILKPLADEVKRLREERDRLDARVPILEFEVVHDSLPHFVHSGSLRTC
jgi:hypothetical protein